jgi:uncharacterized protein YbjT (DUF2867 family)
MTNSGLKIILTGATGMVGEGVLRVCLEQPEVEQILVVTRSPSGIYHEKLEEIILKDFFNVEKIRNEITGYDACFFCAGISAIGKKEEEYLRVTHDLTLQFAKIFSAQNPDAVFIYVSGAGTNPNGKLMWARVKGKTEQDLQKLPLQVYNFRPAIMKPRKEAKQASGFYQYSRWLHNLGQKLFPNAFSTTDEVGLAMLESTMNGYSKTILEVSDINKLS